MAADFIKSRFNNLAWNSSNATYAYHMATYAYQTEIH